MKSKITIILLLSLTYILLNHFVPYWNYLLYPINLLVTFLHEFWHALWALITWGSIKWIQINHDGSWYAITSGWLRSIVLIGWYVWSAILWNILLYIWLTKSKYSEKVIYFLWGLMIFTSIVLFNSILSSLILIVLGLLLIFFAKQTKFDSIFLSFLWLVSVLFIIEDFNVWPSSDLSKFADLFVIFPQWFWMYTWLLIVLVITWFNFRLILKK